MAADNIGQIHDINLGPAKTVRWDDGSWGADGVWDAGTNTFIAAVVQSVTDTAEGDIAYNMDNNGDPTSAIVSGKGHSLQLDCLITVPASPGVSDQTIAYNIRLDKGHLVEVNDTGSAGWVRYIVTDSSKSFTVEQGTPSRFSINIQRLDGMQTALDAT